MRRLYLNGMILSTLILSAVSHGFGSKRSCEIEGKTSQINSLVSRYVSRGANGRSSAVSIKRFSSNGSLIQNIYAKSENNFQAIASTQKILTAWTAYKSGQDLNLSERFTSDDLFYDNQGIRAKRRNGSKINPGDFATLNDYIWTLLTHSSNGASHAIARGSSNSVNSFMIDMNDRMYELLGANARSYFQNPSGLTDNSSRYRFAPRNKTQGSTASELATIAGKIMSDSGFRRALGKAGMQNAPNGFLWKGGYTRAAGRTVVIRFNNPRDKCSSEGIAVAAFGEHDRSQTDRFASFYRELYQLIRE